MNEWWIYKGTGVPHEGIKELPDPPNWRNWRTFKGEIIERTFSSETIEDIDTIRHIGRKISRASVQDEQQDSQLVKEIELVNAALFLRRPLLITGKPGSGKSSLARFVAHELKLGSVLRWPITTRSTLAQGLYSYDAIGRLQDTSSKDSLASNSTKKGISPDIGKYVHLGPLGTALLPVKYPRVLLIDEIDKSDIDLPNDLLNIFEEGEFEIPELVRVAEKEPVVYVMPADGKEDKDRVPIKKGRVQCSAFPFIVLTSNEEREFPPAFLRRCLRLELRLPNAKQLAEIVEAHFDDLEVGEQKQIQQLIDRFLKLRDESKGDVPTDQLLNTVYMVFRAKGITALDKEKLFNLLVRPLSTSTSSTSR